jgi:purine-binding chemotaxis protein CheW
MVDLVKIRKKKAEKKKEEEAAQQPETSAPEAAEPQTTDHRPPTTESQPSAAGNQQPSSGKLEKFKQEAGKRRVDIDTTQAAEETQTDQLELLTFVIAGEHYAVDIERIVEIVTPRPVTRIPNADTSVVGIISLRGTIVTLVDVRRKLRHAVAGEANADTRIVVIDFHHEMVGFIVDRVLRVVKTTRAAIEPHPVVHATELDESIRGVFRTGGSLTILLDLDKLLDHTALAARSA